MALGFVEVLRNATDVPEAGRDLVVLGVFGRCAPVLTYIVTTISAIGPRASREPVHAGSPECTYNVFGVKSLAYMPMFPVH